MLQLGRKPFTVRKALGTSGPSPTLPLHINRGCRHMLESIWMAALAILAAAAVLWLWSVRQADRAQRHRDEKNPIDIES
jgi:hypothetical protein